jgi:polyvinyl alcohol dehydrogenase (cytochrome)
LHLWYVDPVTGFDDPTFVDVSAGVNGGIDNRTDGDSEGTLQRYCMIDRSIGTAGGVMIHDGWAYVAANRPGPNGPGGIYRYEIADFPAAGTDCGGHGEDTDLVDAGVVTREPWLPSDAFALTPSAVVASGREIAGNPTYYVSSVFTGVVAEYVDTGAARVHVRNVVEPPGGAPVGQLDDVNRPFDEGGFPRPNDDGTPFGMGVGPDGSLWYADLGIQGDGPVDGKGSIQRVTFDSEWNVRDHLVADEGLTYPEGIGIVSFGVDGPDETDGDLPERRDKDASSERACQWAMYGHGAARDFALPDSCESPIRSTSVGTLVPKWKLETEKTVTASPAVVDGVVYVGDWSGTMYAVDAESGATKWTFDVQDSPGAAFGPIVSSAAVADVEVVKGLAAQRLVVFGAGPRLYALNAATGAEEWVFSLDSRDETFVEIESSPVVWKGIVFVGIGNHNHAGTGVPGGLVALDAATGEELWRFEPELGADQGCGTVWSSPVVEGSGRRPLVYLATANCTRRGWTWTRHVEAVTALDARTGAPVWSFQPHIANLKDWDFGSTPNLFTDPETGERVLGAPNKDGAYYALDPQTGALRWSRKLVMPGDVNDNFSIGGFLGSAGAKDGVVFGGTAIGGPPYYHALDAASGSLRWHGAQAPSYAASAAVNDVAFAAALDGVVRAYHLQTGAVLWSAPLLGPGSSGPAVVDDTVYVGSGTSSSDACAKELPVNEQCLALFDQVLGGLGGIEAFELPVQLPAAPKL